MEQLEEKSKNNLKIDDEEARRRLGQVYALLLNLASQKENADPEDISQPEDHIIEPEEALSTERECENDYRNN